MKISLIAFIISIVLFGVVTFIKARAVDVKVFYSSLSCNSQIFIVNQLYPTYHMMPQKMHLHMYPFGKCKVFEDTNGTKIIEAEHGDKECKINLLATCAIGVLKEPCLYLPFIRCIEMSDDPETSGERCSCRLNLHWTDLKDCITSCQGTQLVLKMAKATASLSPSPVCFPWIIFDNIFDMKLMKKAKENFITVISDLSSGCSLEGKSAFQKICYDDDEVDFFPNQPVEGCHSNAVSACMKKIHAHNKNDTHKCKENNKPKSNKEVYKFVQLGFL